MSNKKSPLFWVAFAFTILAISFIGIPLVMWFLWLIMKGWNEILNFMVYLW